MNNNKFFELASEIGEKYKEILEYTPKDSKHLKYLTESCLLFASFVAYVNDDIEKTSKE